MKKTKKIILILITIFIELILLLVLFLYKLKFCLLLVLLILLFTISYLIYYCWTTRNEDALYKSCLNDILKSYNSILVKLICLPEFTDRNIITVANFDDLIIAQMEIRKPISYFEELDSCTFILHESQDSYIYILKKNALVRPIIQNYLECAKTKKEKTYSNLLSDIEKTTIIKLENSKSYKISPIRKQKSKEVEILSFDNEII